jgi:hypothetical protein
MVRLFQVPAPLQRVLAPLCFLGYFGAISEKRGPSAGW